MTSPVERLTKLIDQSNCVVGGYPKELAEFLVSHGVIHREQAVNYVSVCKECRGTGTNYCCSACESCSGKGVVPREVN
jgi:hypothetical protein